LNRIAQMEPWFGEEEKRAVAEYMDSGGWITEFKKTQEFEEVIAAYVGSKHCIVTTNGTIAIVLMLLAAGIEPGDEVIVPDYTMIASANAVRLVGAVPVLVDVDPENFCVDLGLAEQAITSRTRALMVVSINGRAPDMSAALDLCRRRGIVLVEDAAQSLGSRQRGKHLGTFGVVGSFSFSTPKVISTGQGGAIVTDDDKIAERARLIKDFGRSRPGVDHHILQGYNFKFTDIQAVIGLEQMKKLNWRVQRKKEMYALYRELVSDPNTVEFPATDLENTSPWFVDVLVPLGARDALKAHLHVNGIGSRPFYPAIHSQQPYLLFGSDLSVSTRLSQSGLWLPSSSFLHDKDIEYVCNAIMKYTQAKRRNESPDLQLQG